MGPLLPGLAAIAVAAAVAGCGVDRQQVRSCQHLIAAFEGETLPVRIVEVRGDADGPNSILLRYRVPTQGSDADARWISCRFGGDAFEAGRLAVVGVATDRRGRLSPIDLQMLLIWQRLPPRTGGVPEAAKAALSGPLYLLQQIVNAVPSAAIYALIAVGFSLVYGIIGRINLALGEMAAVGGHVAFLAIVVLAAWGGSGLGLDLAAALAAAAAVSGVCGWVTQRTLFRRWAEGETQAALIATLGLAIFLREFLRLSQGARDRWLQPFPAAPLVVAGDGPLAVAISPAQFLILAVAAVTCAGILVLTRRGPWGRAYRACRDDIGMAALLGVDGGRIVAIAFAAGAAAAGVAGFVIAFHYGTVSAYMGTLIGFKALVAAVVGGLGSVGGAIAGGIAVGLIETLWAGYFAGEYRDVVVFALLAAVLVFRPQGLLGAAPARQDR
jgi:branched-chain amino acid transport system permease protein